MASNSKMYARVTGFVQGVGFRWFVQRELVRLGLTGHAENMADGSVEVTAEGARAACEQLADVLRAGERTPGSVEDVTVEWSI